MHSRCRGVAGTNLFLKINNNKKNISSIAYKMGASLKGKYLEITSFKSRSYKKIKIKILFSRMNMRNSTTPMGCVSASQLLPRLNITVTFKSVVFTLHRYFTFRHCIFLPMISIYLVNLSSDTRRQ